MSLREHAIEWWFVVPPLLINVSALPGETPKRKNRIFSLACSISALPDFDRSLAYFIQSCYSQLMLLLLCGSPNLVIIEVKLWTVLEPQPRKKGRWMFALYQLDCVEWNKYQCIILLKDKIAISMCVTCFIVSNICWDSKVSQQYCLLVFTPGLVKNNPHFDTTTGMVIMQHVGDI